MGQTIYIVFLTLILIQIENISANFEERLTTESFSDCSCVASGHTGPVVSASYGRCLAYYETVGDWFKFHDFCLRSNLVVGAGAGSAGILINDDYLKIKSAWNGRITKDFFIGLILDYRDNPPLQCPFWNNWEICPDYPLLQSDLPDGNNFNDSSVYHVAMIPANFSAARQWMTYQNLNAVLCEFVCGTTNQTALCPPGYPTTCPAIATTIPIMETTQQDTTATPCNFSLVDTINSNYITSPNYPNPYDIYTDVCWTFELSNNANYIQWVFEKFETETGFDVLSVYASPTPSGNPIFSYSGTHTHEWGQASVQQYNSRYYTFAFRTDSSVNRAGFAVDVHGWQFKQETMAEKKYNPDAPVKNQRGRIRNSEYLWKKYFNVNKSSDEKR